MTEINGAALVTGANRGLGAAFAQALVERGVGPVYGGVRDPKADVPSGVTPIELDVPDHRTVQAAADRCADVQLLINNAGVVHGQTFLGAPTLDAARAEMEVNYFGYLAMARAFAPVLARNGGGALVNILSIVSFFNFPANGSQNASKAAAWSMTNGLRMELRDQGTLVVAVHSGFIDTRLAAGIDVPNTPPPKSPP